MISARWALLDDGGVVDGIRGQLLVRDHEPVSSSARMNVYVSLISSTTPSTPSTVTRSPSRSGCVNAIRMPATKLPSVRCEAKPTMMPDHGARGEQPAGDRSHLRDHEQRREDGDDDDHRHHGAAQDAVARLGAGRSWTRRIATSTIFASTIEATITTAAIVARSQNGIDPRYSTRGTAILR